MWLILILRYSKLLSTFPPWLCFGTEHIEVNRCYASIYHFVIRWVGYIMLQLCVALSLLGIEPTLFYFYFETNDFVFVSVLGHLTNYNKGSKKHNNNCKWHKSYHELVIRTFELYISWWQARYFSAHWEVSGCSRRELDNQILSRHDYDLFGILKGYHLIWRSIKDLSVHLYLDKSSSTWECQLASFECVNTNLLIRHIYAA